MMTDTDTDWSAPFDNEDVSSVTPVPYGDLHTVSPYVATPQVGQSLYGVVMFPLDSDASRPIILYNILSS